MKLKSCGRCGGDMFEEDMPGFHEIVCLQCGMREPLPGKRFPIRQNHDQKERKRKSKRARARAA